jgi:hypothetical protein
MLYAFNISQITNNSLDGVHLAHQNQKNLLTEQAEQTTLSTSKGSVNVLTLRVLPQLYTL